jgi:3-phosphoshikimate 1-carboxyvinyltransferase
MTLQILNDFGISAENINYEVFRIAGKQKFHSRNYNIEGDWSGAAFLLAAGAINGRLVIEGLSTASKQSDMSVMDALKKAGAEIRINDSTIEISRSEMKAFNFDATECPDLFPPLAAIAAYCNGETRIKGVSRLIHKESNRAAALQEEFGKLGIAIELNGDLMIITGGKVSGGNTFSHDDHRIAMALAVAALGASGKVIIKDAHCVAKSYPGFFDDMRKLGVVVYE